MDPRVKSHLLVATSLGGVGLTFRVAAEAILARHIASPEARSAVARPLTLLVVGGGTLFAALVMLVYRWSVLRRVIRLSACVTEAGERGDWSVRFPVEGRDYLSKLADAINGMLGALSTAQRQVLDIIEFLPDATFAIDREHRVIAWNKAMEKMTGVPKEEIVGRAGYAYAVPFYRERRPVLADLVCSYDQVAATRYDHLERKGQTLFGEVFAPALAAGEGAYLFITASPLLDHHGNVMGAIESIRDITQRKRTEEQLKDLSLRDHLTGLYNRAHFEAEMRRLDREGRGAPVGLIMCDVDGLKLVNDTLGHDEGDKLLLAAAGVLKACFRAEDLVARIGGDEFAVLLPATDASAVERACERVRETIATHNAANPNRPLSMSLGLAVAGDPSVKMTDLFKEADDTMYREKLHRSQSARSGIVQAFMTALEAKDFISEGHAERLRELVGEIASALGFSGRRREDLALLAQFHDIGKVGISDSILFKPGPLTPEEKVEMQRHCDIGHRIAQAAPDLAPVADWILKHHEWWDGRGYPLGLKGEEIPLECRILAIADAYDALTNDRPYRRALSHRKAIAALRQGAGTQFDPQLLFRVLKVLDARARRSPAAVSSTAGAS